MSEYRESVEEQAVRLFRGMANLSLVKKAQALVESGEAEWQQDPYRHDVVGLVLTGTNRAVVVVYLSDEDFESDYEFMGE